MWLLNAATRRLEHFNSEDEVPGGYAILSHTWGPHEVTFDQVQCKDAFTKQGYEKINPTCRQALEDGLKYVWMDTCTF